MLQAAPVESSVGVRVSLATLASQPLALDDSRLDSSNNDNGGDDDHMASPVLLDKRDSQDCDSECFQSPHRLNSHTESDQAAKFLAGNDNGLHRKEDVSL